jgi:hypothetical protein
MGAGSPGTQGPRRELPFRGHAERSRRSAFLELSVSIGAWRTDPPPAHTIRLSLIPFSQRRGCWSKSYVMSQVRPERAKARKARPRSGSPHVKNRKAKAKAENQKPKRTIESSAAGAPPRRSQLAVGTSTHSCASTFGSAVGATTLSRTSSFYGHGSWGPTNGDGIQLRIDTDEPCVRHGNACADT